MLRRWDPPHLSLVSLGPTASFVAVQLGWCSCSRGCGFAGLAGQSLVVGLPRPVKGPLGLVGPNLELVLLSFSCHAAALADFFDPNKTLNVRKLHLASWPTAKIGGRRHQGISLLWVQRMPFWATWHQTARCLERDQGQLQSLQHFIWTWAQIDLMCRVCYFCYSRHEFGSDGSGTSFLKQERNLHLATRPVINRCVKLLDPIESCGLHVVNPASTISEPWNGNIPSISKPMKLVSLSI